MNTRNLGRLEKVDLREVWASESSGFTSWLAQPENLKLLGETIGIDLECEAQDKAAAEAGFGSVIRASRKNINNNNVIITPALTATSMKTTMTIMTPRHYHYGDCYCQCCRQNR